MQIGRSAEGGFKNGRSPAGRNAAETLPHLFKLPGCDAHGRILPVLEKLQKQKRRGDFSPGRFAKVSNQRQCPRPFWFWF